LKAETTICFETAEKLVESSYPSPLGRLPVIAYQNSLPILLAEGDLSENEVSSLLTFYGKVEQINRGLDQAEVRLVNKPDLLQREHNRNRFKAEKLQMIHIQKWKG
jgi:hypothetical protein